MSDLLVFLGSIHPLPDDLADRLRSITGEQYFSRKTYLVRAGQLSQNVYFINKGLLRSFYSTGEKEISSGFIKEGELCFPIEHLFHHPYGMETIQALEETMTQIIPFKQWLAAYDDFPVFRTIGLRLIEKYVQAHYLRFRAMWMQPAADRYHWLQERLPDLAARVQARYLASLLGMSNVMYSRLGGQY